MKTHSTLSRRDFMKALGVGAAGVGAAAIAAPAFNDLDDMMASDKNNQEKRPWWIKEKDVPTTNIAWESMRRPDGQDSGQSEYIWATYLGAEAAQKILDNTKQNKTNGVKNNTPGIQFRDVALYAGSAHMMNNIKSSYVIPVGMSVIPPVFPGMATYGVPKYEGTPEENSKMIRAALRFYGAGLVGFGELTQQLRDTIVYTCQKTGSSGPAFNWQRPPDTVAKKIVFEGTERGRIDNERYLQILPDIPLWYMTMTLPMAKEPYRTGPNSFIQQSANINRYRIFSQIQYSIQHFMYHLGYDCYGYDPMPMMGMIPAIAGAQLTGLAEGARNNGVAITPEYGPVNGYFALITNMPLAETKPIDAGIWRFCHTCTKCASACPTESIPFDKEPTWDIPDIYGKPDLTHNPGREQFWYNAVSCWTYIQESQGCGTCMATCTFNTNSASIHEVVRATLSTTSLFNGFMWRADSWFGYGLYEDKESWWDMSLPINGWDSNIFAGEGRYNR